MSGRAPEEPTASADRTETLSQLIELERAQIGAEIHDSLLPLIFAASAATSSLLQAELIDETQRERLQQVGDWLSEAMTTGRQMLTQIYPPELTGTCWTDAARDSISRRFTESNTELHWDVDADLESLSRAIALTAYRIAVEAIRNAITHGNATEVWIRGRSAGDQHRIEIEDNGCGFDIDQVANDRFGIKSIHARATLIGGKAQIQSQPGQGTTVAVTW